MCNCTAFDASFAIITTNYLQHPSPALEFACTQLQLFKPMVAVLHLVSYKYSPLCNYNASYLIVWAYQLLYEKSSYNIPRFVQLQCQVTTMSLGGYCHVKFIAIVEKSLVTIIVEISLVISSRNVWVTTLDWQNDYLHYQA
jgi:hypothetical protein